MTLEQLAAEVQKNANQISHIQAATTMTEHERHNSILGLRVCLNAVLSQFVMQMDETRKDVTDRLEEEYLKKLFLKTIDVVDVEMLPGRRTIAG